MTTLGRSIAVLVPSDPAARDRLLAVARGYALEPVVCWSPGALSALVARGQISLVVVEALSSLGETAMGTFRLLADLRSANAGLVSLAEGMLHPEAAEPVLQAAAAIITADRKRVLTEARAVRRRSRARGVRYGRQPLKFDEARAKALLADGVPLSRVAKELGVSRRTLRRRVADTASCESSR